MPPNLIRLTQFLQVPPFHGNEAEVSTAFRNGYLWPCWWSDINLDRAEVILVKTKILIRAICMNVLCLTCDIHVPIEDCTCFRDNFWPHHDIVYLRVVVHKPMVRRLRGKLLRVGRNTVGRINVVSLTFDTELIGPSHTNGAVTNEFSMDVCWLFLPVAEGIFFYGVARTTACCVVEESNGINGYNAIVCHTKGADWQLSSVLIRTVGVLKSLVFIQ